MQDANGQNNFTTADISRLQQMGSSPDGYVYLVGSTITSNDKGVEASSSGIFLRNGAKIQNSYTYGIDITGNRDEVNQTYTSLLSIGDLGCGWVINSTGTAIKANNTLLSIDAIVHSTTNGAIIPNHFEGNPMILDVCYGGTGTPFVSGVSAQGNIWELNGTTPITPVASKFVAKTGQTCSYTMANFIDYSNWSTCYANCTYCSGSGGGEINGRIGSIDSNSDGVKAKGKKSNNSNGSSFSANAKGSGFCNGEIDGIGTIANIFSTAYSEFANTDSITDDFAPLSNYFLRDSLNNWLNEDSSVVAGHCLDFIRVSSYLYPTGTNNSYRKGSLTTSTSMKTVEAKSIMDGYKIYPNPASSEINIENPLNNLLTLKVFNSVGICVLTKKVESRSISVSLNLESGIYKVSLINSNGALVHTEKLVITK